MARKKLRYRIVGSGKDKATGEERQVISGEFIFKMIDSYGIPLDIILELMIHNNISFSVPGFIQAAYRSKNFTTEKIYIMLSSESPKECLDDIKYWVDYIYSGGEYNE